MADLDSGDLPVSDLYCEHLDADAPRGIVVLVHGYAEHSGRYGRLTAALVASGYSVLLYDHRGFGRSPGRPAYVACINGLVADLSWMVQSARTRWPGAPLYVMGHSMGGLVATLYCLAAAPPPDGLILSSPLLASKEAPLMQSVASLVGAVAPRLPTLKMDRRAISRQADVVLEAEQDPLNYHGRIPARTGAEFIRGMKTVRAQGHRIAQPLLVLHGTADTLTDPVESAAFYARASSDHKQLSLFEGSYHETLNDLDGDRVVDAILGWLTDLGDGQPLEVG